MDYIRSLWSLARGIITVSPIAMYFYLEQNNLYLLSVVLFIYPFWFWLMLQSELKTNNSKVKYLRLILFTLGTAILLVVVNLSCRNHII